MMDLQDQIIELKSLSRIFKECPFSDKFFLTAVIIFQAQIELFRSQKRRWHAIPLGLFLDANSAKPVGGCAAAVAVVIE